MNLIRGHQRHLGLALPVVAITLVFMFSARIAPGVLAVAAPVFGAMLYAAATHQRWPVIGGALLLAMGVSAWATYQVPNVDQRYLTMILAWILGGGCALLLCPERRRPTRQP